MPSPFPGMDAYLENSEIWSEVHNRLIVAIADIIAVPLRPNYYVAIEKRTYLSEPEDRVLVGIPDVSVFTKGSTRQGVGVTVTLSSLQEPLTVTVPIVEEVRENYLEIREGTTGSVITTIELLSPKNKRSGEGRNAYLRKRQQVLASYTHLIEIDLLRGGNPMPIQGSPVSTDYRILISREDRRPSAQLYAFDVQDCIPVFLLPLQLGDTEPLVNLKPILDGVYERAGFDLRIDYSQPVQPPLTEKDEVWANVLLQEKGLRRK